jgi:ABC-2 type transport system permease protein
MAGETRQAIVLAGHGWFTPLLALSDASRALAGTDLPHHHRFLQEAEALRFAFVQELNRIHAEKLSYSDDIRRSSDAQAEARTRVDSSHWQLLDRFVFEPDAAGVRLARSKSQWLMLVAWFVVLVGASAWVGGRLKP